MLSRAVLLLSSRGIALRSLTALPSSAVVASSLSTSSSVPAYSASRGWHVTDAFSPCLPSAASPWMLSLGHLSKTKSNGFATVSSPTENPAASSNDADADADAHVHADETSNYSSQPSAAAAATSQKKNTASNAGTSAPHPDAENAGTFTDSYPGIASAPLSDEIIELLRAPVRDSAVAMLPTGGLFLPVATYRAILDRVFGVGGWALIGRGSFQFIPNSSKAIRDYALFAHGRFLVETTGEATVDRDGSLEAAKSLALSRCCKYLGIAADIQDPNWQQAWREKHAETVFAENRKTHQKRKIWKLRGEALPWPWTPVPLNATYGQRSNSNHGNSSSSSSWSPPPPSPPKDDYSLDSDNFDAPAMPSISAWSPPDSLPLNSNPHMSSSFGGDQPFNPHELVPDNMKKVQGKRWIDVLQDPAGIRYLTFLAEQSQGTVKQQASRALEYWSAQSSN